MKKRMIFPVLALSLAALLVATGCSTKTPPPVSGGSSQVEDVMPPTQPEGSTGESGGGAVVTGEATSLVNLLGKGDADVVAAYGEGTAVKDESGVVNAREYTTAFFGKDVTMTMGYDEDKAVSLIAVYAVENDFAHWDAQLTTELGEPSTDTTNNDEGSDTKEKVWTVDASSLVSLKDAYGALSLEVFRGA